MKKSLINNFIFIIVFILILFPVFSSAAGPTLVASSISATAVTLNSTGLTPNQSYLFKFSFLVGSLQSQVTADADGKASGSFAQLNPNETYTVNLFKYDSVTGAQTNSGAPTLQFKTLADTSGAFFDNTSSTSGPIPVTSSPIPTSGPIPVTSTPIPTSGPIPVTSSPIPITSSPIPINQTPTTTPTTTPTQTPTITPTTTTTPSSATTQTPSATFTAGLVPCTNTPTVSGNTVTYASKCDFNALMALVNKVINFMLYFMAVPIAAIMFTYAGFELVTSGGSTEKRGIAKKVFTNAVIGFILAAASWIIVKTILSLMGYNDGTWIGF